MAKAPPRHRPHTQPQSTVERRAAYDKLRQNANARGYDWQWRKVSHEKLTRDPLCEFERGHVVNGVRVRKQCKRRATEVDHRVPIAERPDLRLVWSNLRSACRTCHAAHTARTRTHRQAGSD